MGLKNEAIHFSDDGVVDLCGSDDDEDVDIVTEHVSVKKEANTTTTALAIVTPPSSKKRKLANQETKVEQTERNERTTRSKSKSLKKEENEANTESLHGVGTIIRKWFNIDGNYYEGEVTSYDPINKYYKIKYEDGDEEDFDEQDMNQYIKQNQWYSRTTCDFTAGRSNILDDRRDVKDEMSCSNIEDGQNDQPIIPETSSSASSPEVKREMAEQKKKAAFRDAREIYGDRVFLHRFNGIGRLGGGYQSTFAQPCKGNQKVWNGNKLRPEYPLHKMALKKNTDDEDVYDMDTFCYLGYNTTWHPNAPKFATQPTAAVDVVPSFMKEKGLATPIFMKRSLTRKSDKRERKILGWEYVGNYRCISDEDLVVWESADNFTEASKREIASKTLRSAKSQNGETYGRHLLDFWREELKKRVEEGDNDKDTKKARDLGFKSDMNDEDLSNLIVQLDRFHGQEIIEFVEYDERIYEYCSKGLTSKNSKGEILAKYGGDIAKASDWYDFANEHMLM